MQTRKGWSLTLSHSSHFSLLFFLPLFTTILNPLAKCSFLYILFSLLSLLYSLLLSLFFFFRRLCGCVVATLLNYVQNTRSNALSSLSLALSNFSVDTHTHKHTQTVSRRSYLCVPSSFSRPAEQLRTSFYYVLLVLFFFSCFGRP